KPLPRLKEGEPVASLESLVSSRDTQPPSPFTDATLLAAMTGIARFVSDPALRKTLRDTDGLGTEATRAGILQTLFVREFLTREGRAIHATERGLALVDALPASVAAPDRTAHWEAQLETVRHGKDSEGAFIERLQKELKNLLQHAMSGTAQVPDTGVHCPRCRAPMRQRSGKFGDFWSCHRYPECTGTRPLEDDPQQDDGMDQPPIPCPKCFSPLIRRTSAQGHFWGCSAYPGCRTRFQDRDGKPVIPLP
ncbi:MAG: DNA topoisomerase III, partial [Halomonadaceae bacterium]